MPKVEVDGVETEVPQGATVPQAREMTGLARLALLAVLLAAPGAAFAHQRNAGAVQEREGYLPPAERSARLPMKGRDESAGVRAQAARYAACVVDKVEAQARVSILAEPHVVSRRDIQRLVNSECLARVSGLGSAMRFPPPTFQYVIADALFRTDFAAQPPLELGSVPRLSHPSLPPQAGEGEAAARLATIRAVAVLSRLGECVVRLDPAASAALLRSDVESAAEASALAALKPALGECLPEGARVALSPAPVRGTIALNYYRLAHAARQTQSTRN